jgi:hypothetical protein
MTVGSLDGMRGFSSNVIDIHRFFRFMNSVNLWCNKNSLNTWLEMLWQVLKARHALIRQPRNFKFLIIVRLILSTVHVNNSEQNSKPTFYCLDL